MVNSLEKSTLLKHWGSDPVRLFISALEVVYPVEIGNPQGGGGGKSRSGLRCFWQISRLDLLKSVAPGPLGPRGLGPPLNVVLAKKRQYSSLDKFFWPPPQPKRGSLTFFRPDPPLWRTSRLDLWSKQKLEFNCKSFRKNSSKSFKDMNAMFRKKLEAKRRQTMSYWFGWLHLFHCDFWF